MTLALFEDVHQKNLSPLTLTKACFDIKVGAKTHLESYSRPPDLLITREYLEDLTAEKHPKCQVNPPSADSDTVFVNGLVDPNAIDFEKLMTSTRSFIFCSGERILATRLSKKEDRERFILSIASGRNIRVKQLTAEKTLHAMLSDDSPIITEPWEIIKNLQKKLAGHVHTFDGRKARGIKVLGDASAVIAPNAQIEEDVVFDTRKGGIYIASGAMIGPSRIIGPTFIGERSQIKQFSTIESSYIGTDCRIAGEVEHSIICDYTNKAHSGFVGHSYVGEWVNLGALSTTSDLKLTYGDIKMITSSGHKVSTRMNKLGAFISDMVKTSIGSLIYGGLRIGVSSHLAGLVANDVPSFTICLAQGRRAELELESAIRIQERMMSRRNRQMSETYKKMVQYVFAATAGERKRSRVRRMKLSS